MKNYLFIDGSNLYGGQYKLFGPKKHLDFSKLVKCIENKLKTKFDNIYFYASYSPKFSRLTQKIKQYIFNEKAFYNSVYKCKNANFFKGYRSKTSGKEKEVDVKLATDIVDMAHLNRFDNIFLFSGDADFMHALVVAKRLRKKITIFALENRIPHRFSYLFTTYVFHFNKLPQLKLNKHQKIKFIKINPKETVSTIKIPR